MKVANLKVHTKRAINGNVGCVEVKTDYRFAGHDDYLTIPQIDPALALRRGVVIASHFYDEDCRLNLVVCGNAKKSSFFVEVDQPLGIAYLVKKEQLKRGRKPNERTDAPND